MSLSAFPLAKIVYTAILIGFFAVLGSFTLFIFLLLPGDNRPMETVDG